MMKVFYRISDGSYKKIKLPGADKEFCLRNFQSVFRHVESYMIADNCQKSLELVKDHNRLHKTNLGNAGSLMYAIELAIKEGKDSDELYFVEDDYLHLDKAYELIREGLGIADYVTVYDHPDKYTKLYDYGEVSKVVKTKSSHWRYTISTCMTFATTVAKLKEDLEVWKKHTTGFHPHDHSIFTDLKQNGRSLAVCIPGVACHTDLTFSGWVNSVEIDEWAIDMLCKEIESKLDPSLTMLKKSIVKDDMKGWDRLKRLDALRLMKK